MITNQQQRQKGDKTFLRYTIVCIAMRMSERKQSERKEVNGKTQDRRERERLEEIDAKGRGIYK